jgi:hypothetical protein
MASRTILLEGTINEQGQLQIDLPANLPPGHITVQIEYQDEHQADPNADDRPKPMTGAEIIAAGLTGGWKDKGIEDSVAWVEEQRRKQSEKRQTRW